MADGVGRTDVEARRTGRGSRRAVLAAAAAFGFGILLTTSAWACTGLATLNSTPTPGPGHGRQVQVKGTGFRPSGEEVAVRADDPQGEVLATARPDGKGTFAVAVDLAAVGTGNHILVATEHDSGPLGQILAKHPVKVPAIGSPSRPLLQAPRLPAQLPWIIAGVFALLSVPLLPPALPMISVALSHAARRPAG